MKSLVKTPHNFTTNKTFTGSYVGIDENSKMFVFEDANLVPALIPSTPHTRKAVEQIMIGTIVQIDAVGDAFDVSTLDEAEIKAWKEAAKTQSVDVTEALKNR